MKNRIKYIVIGLLIGCFAGLFLYDTYLVSDDVITVHDSTVIEIPVDVPVPYEVVKLKYTHTTHTDTLILIDTIKLYDTIYIVQDFKFKRIYSDTIKDDDLVVYLDETIQFNRITNRDFSYQILRPMYSNSEKHNKVYLGMNYTGTVYPNISYYKNNWYLSAGYSPFDKSIMIGCGFQLFEW